MVSRAPVQDGQPVAAGAVMAEITDPSLQADIEAAQAKLTEARANLAAQEPAANPRTSPTSITTWRARSSIWSRRKRTTPALQRLAAKQAATQEEAQAARDKVQQTRTRNRGPAKAARSLVSSTEVAAARARLRDAETALSLARQRAAHCVVRAPIAGVVYGLEVRPGAYLNAGDLVANVGRLDRLRVRVYVDEPELGRVAVGQPVTIRWEALPGKAVARHGGQDTGADSGAGIAAGGRGGLHHRESRPRR